MKMIKSVATAQEYLDQVVAPHTRVNRSLLATAIGQLPDLKAETFGVIGSADYVRFLDTDRTSISDFIDQMLRLFSRGRDGCKGSVVWAPSGTGKTSLVKGIAAAHPGIKFVSLNVASPTFRADAEQLLASRTTDRTLVLFDEIDAASNGESPYQVLLGLVEQCPAQRVYLLAGSSQKGLEGMVSEITRRDKGTDLMNRIRGRFSIPPLCLGDYALMFAASVREAANGRGTSAVQIDRFALFYLLAAKITNGHGIRDLATAAVYRMDEVETRLRFVHLFDSGDKQLFNFHHNNSMAAEKLANRWVGI